MLDITQDRITAAEFLALYPDETSEHIELLDGELITMPTPTPEHQDISINLTVLFVQAIKPEGLGRLQVAPSEIHFDEYTILQPDLFFVAKDNLNCYVNLQKRWQGVPDVCIEILSPSTGKHDRQTKFEIYERFGVREYWIVDPFMQTIEIFVRRDERYQRQGVYSGEDMVNSDVLSALSFPAQEIFA